MQWLPNKPPDGVRSIVADDSDRDTPEEKEDKFDAFTAEGEAVGYISLDQAVLASVRGQPGAAGPVHPFDMLRTGLAHNYIVSLPNLLWNFLCPDLSGPKTVKHWSLRSVQVKLILRAFVAEMPAAAYEPNCRMC